MLIVILGGVSAVMASAEFLDQYGLLRFPLGFYLLAQGLLFVLVAAAFWAASVQDEIDRSYAESEEP
jgi:putative solute:sodium symporter small subunit